MEKRLYPRVASVLPIEIKFEDTANNVLYSGKGQVVNLSETGLCIMLDKNLPASLQGSVLFDPSSKYPSFKTKAKVIWSNKLEGKNKFHCGIDFLDLDTKEIKVFKQILSDNGRKSFVFEKTVYLGDTNAEGNVYFAKYLDWQGMAREEFYKQNFPVEALKSGLKLITVHASIDYKHEAFLFDEILIAVFVANVKKASLDLIFNYRNKATKQLLATGSQTIAFGDFKGNLIPIPKEIKEIVKYFLSEETTNKAGDKL